MENIKRFRFYFIIIAFGMCTLLFHLGIPKWSWKMKISDEFKYQQNNGTDNRILKAKNNNQNHNQLMNLKPLNLNYKNGTVLKSRKESLDEMKQRISQLSYVKDAELQPPWSYERFLANMTLIAVKNKSQKEFSSLLTRALNPLKALPKIPPSEMKRVILVTYFRSGSTFLGDLLQQNWKSFYTFEPLHYMTNGIRISDDKSFEGIELISRILRCDFMHIPKYLQWVQKEKNQFLFKWNRFLWSICRFRLFACFEPNYITEVCNRAKVHVMKLARLHMRHVQMLMKRLEGLDVNVVYLVRDPRGTLSSRQKLSWCTQHYNCTDVDSLCAEMREDLNIFKTLRNSNPSKYTLVRYEDLSINSTYEPKALLNRLNIPYSATVQRYIRTHMNASANDLSKRNPYTTTRNSKSIAFEWKHTLNVTDIIEVQNKCGDLLAEFGYKLIKSFDRINDSEPVIENNYPLKIDYN